MAYFKRNSDNTGPNYVEADKTKRAVSVEALYAVINKSPAHVVRMFEEQKAADARAKELRNLILYTVEQDMSKAGLLADNVAYAPFFNFGELNVAEVYGERHTAERTKKATANNAVNNAALIAERMAAARAEMTKHNSKLIKRK